jgi:pilus assembly protein CpaC
MSRLFSRRLPALALAMVLQAGAAGAALGQPLDGLRGGPADGAPAAPYGSEAPLRLDLGGQDAGVHTLAIPRGKSAMIDLPVDARDVMVSNPAVAQPIMRTPRRISILGVAPGQTDAAFFDAAGRRILGLNIRVDQDFSAVADTIGRILPGSHVHVEGVNGGVVLSGQVANLTDASRAVQIAEQFTAKPEQVLNMLSIAGKDQVMLRVRIVEVQRNVIKQLGVNLSAVIGQAGSPQFLLGTAATFAVNGSLLGGLQGAGYALNTTTQPELQVPCTGPGWSPGSLCPEVVKNASQASNYNTATSQTTVGSPGLNKAGATLDAFEQVGLVRTLAEPNLTAVSGESAQFLAGGEFPVPTGEDNTGKVTIEFKPYGVGLGFTPVVLSGGRISLKVSTEVSELTNQGAFTLAASASGATLTIPGLTVRRASTTVEMPSGGSMMIAGLLQEETKQDLDSLPGLMNLPVLGALFRSRDYQSGETELVVIVTPYLVSPTSPASLQTPADGLQIANDAETDLLGRLNKVYKTPPAAVAGKTYQGPLGYVIE